MFAGFVKKYNTRSYTFNSTKLPGFKQIVLHVSGFPHILFIFLFIETYLHRIKSNHLKTVYIEVLLDFAISSFNIRKIEV